MLKRGSVTPYVLCSKCRLPSLKDIPIKTKGVEALEVKKITIFIKAAGNPYCIVKLYVHDFELV